MAETRGGSLVRVLVRILCVAGGSLVVAFVLAVLGAGTAHADSEDGTGFGAVDSATAAPDGGGGAPNLWADASSVSSAAARRAVVAASEPTPWGLSDSRPARVPVTPSVVTASPPAGIAASTPIGTVGSGSGSTDGGPSISQLAVLSAALAAVLVLSLQLGRGEISWRSAFVRLSIERPG